jgi:hypothetical protein
VTKVLDFVLQPTDKKASITFYGSINYGQDSAQILDFPAKGQDNIEVKAAVPNNHITINVDTKTTDIDLLHIPAYTDAGGFRILQGSDTFYAFLILS